MTTESLSTRLLTRLEVEEFLIEEAAILDGWKLDEWLALFTDDGRYVVPSTDVPDGDPARDLTLIDDDHLRLGWRVNRLKSRHAHREFPWSRTRRLVTNVRVVADRGDELDRDRTDEPQREAQRHPRWRHPHAPGRRISALRRLGIGHGRTEVRGRQPSEPR